VLLENTAGQGSAIGQRFEELAGIVARSAHAARLGVCFDTCHAFAAGYELRDRRAYRATLAAFDRTVGLARLGAFHLNDSRAALGARVDRHAHIGRGQLGLEPFRLLLADPRFRGLPMVLETHKGDDLAEDRVNLAVLRAMLPRSRR
jgi:deoxyribonuclease-4